MRKLLCFALPFAVGTGLCQYLLPESWQLPVAAGVLLLGLALAAVWKGGRTRCALAALGLAVGLGWFWCHAQLTLAPARALVGTEAEVTLELADYPQQQDYGVRCTVRILGNGVPGKAVYYGDSALLGLEPGTHIRTTVKYYDAAVVSDLESTYYTSQGIFIRAYDKEKSFTVSEGRSGTLPYLPQRLARRMMDTIGAVFSPDTAPLVTAVLTGEREALSEQVRSDLEETGLMHITAVSGLHCTFLIGAIGILLLRRQRLTALVGYPVLVFYVLMVGCTPSVVRSAVMMGFLLLGPVLKREGDAATSLGAAALVILGWNPFAVGSVSFQMSFAAVAGMLLLSPRVYAALGGKKEGRGPLASSLGRFLSATLGGSLGTMAFTAPLSAVYFSCVSLVSPIANLTVLWMAPLLFALAFAVTVLCTLCPALAPLAAAPELLARYLQAVAGFLARVPDHAVYFEHSVFTVWLLLVYLLLLICLISRERGRKYLVMGLVALVTLQAARAVPVLTVRYDDLTVIAVDVGQGAATLLRSGEDVVLVDCGSHYVSGGAGGVVADTMATYGWRRLDYVVLTHYHEDHAGGLEQLLSRVEVGELLLPQLVDTEEQGWLQEQVLELAGEHGVPVTYIEEPTLAVLGRAQLALYPPLTHGEVNEEGLTVLCSAGDYDVLITGDMGSSTEKLLLQTYDLPDIELLMVGHHGSRYSTSEALLDALRPEACVISVGQNSYGHPTEETIARICSRGMELYRTDLQGSVLIQVKEKGNEE